MSAQVVFAVVAAAHAGFQVTVTALVYPALVEVGPESWPEAHARHSRRIVALVAVLYVALVLAGAALLVSGPSLAGGVGLLGAVAAIGVTAVLAAPTHARLGDGDPALRRRLLVVDRWRCVAAVVALAGATAGL